MAWLLILIATVPAIMVYQNCSPGFVAMGSLSNISNSSVDSGQASSDSSSPAPILIGQLTKVAGQIGGPGSVDGIGKAAAFNTPLGVNVGPDGSIYVADNQNCTIRKVERSGKTTTVAGSPRECMLKDGPKSDARLHSPAGVAVALDGTIYVSEKSANCIRKIATDGSITTIAGLYEVVSTGIAGGYVDGIGASARFNIPSGIALDSKGNLLVADTGNHVIRKITPDATVSTFAGQANQLGWVDGAAGQAKFNYPMALAFDVSGQLFVADSAANCNCVRVIQPNGSVSSLADSPGQVALNQLQTLPLCNSSFDSNCSGSFPTYTAIAFDTQNRLVLATGSKITRFQVASTLLTADLVLNAQRVAGDLLGEASHVRFQGVGGLAKTADGAIVIADTGSNAIKLLSASGVTSAIAGASGFPQDSIAGLDTPKGFDVDANGDIYVVDETNFIHVVQPSGLASLLGEPSASRSPLNGLALDAQHNVFVTSPYENVIYVTSANGVKGLLAGSLNQSGVVDGPAAQSEFWSPNDVAVAFDGAVLVGDFSNSRIRKISGDRVVSTFTSKIRYPQAMTTTSDGSIYVTSSSSGVVKIDSSGAISQITSLVGLLVSPGSIAYDERNRDLYVGEYFTGVIYKVASDGTASVFAGLRSSATTANIEGPLATTAISTPRFMHVRNGILYFSAGNAVWATKLK